MYTVYAGDRIIYHPELVDNGYAIYNPVVTLEANKSGSFQFTMPVTNVNYNNLQKMSTIITVMNDGDEIFRGRILNDERDFNNNKVVYCEGELAFLLDSIVRPYDYDGTIRGFFGYLVANHNTQVESYKQFTVGDVTVLPDTPFKLSITDYVSTWYMLNTYLLDLFGGYIRVRLNNGLRYLDYVASYENINTQTVAFGTNMLDLSQYVSAERIFTNLIPLGSTYSVELDDSEITVGQLSKTFTEPIGKKNESATPFIFALEVILNSKSKANGTSNITVKYSVKTRDSSTASWSGLDGSKIYADIQLDPGIQGVARVNQKVSLPTKTVNGTEQVLVTWTGNVATGSLVITGEFINNYTKSTAAAGNRPISNSMATVSQLLQQKYLKTTIATVNNNSDVLTDSTAEGLFGKIVAVHTWDDVDDPAELKSLGEQYLADNISMAVKLDVNAVDLNLLNVAYEKFKIGDRIRVVSAPHVLDDYFTCTRITLDLQHPDNNTYRLGREFKTLTETQITAAKDIQVTNEMIAQINNSLDAAESVVEQMNQLINTIYDKYADVTTVINNLDAAYADIDFANIQDAAIANLVANNALITALNAAYAQIDLANISNATIETLMSKQATIDALDASFATINFANITDAAINNLLAKQVLTDYLETNFLQADGANIGTAVVNKLKVEGLADIDFANITQAAINHLVAGDATIQGLDANFADINFANITNTAINNALVNTGLFSSLTVEDDVIVGGTLAADSIAAGSIVADKLVVRGTDGLYYQLNLSKKNDGSISQSDWNALTQAELTSAFHGENIIANSITAKQIHAGTITAEKLATLDASQVTFSNGGTNTTMATFISDINGLSSNVSTITTKVNASVTSYAYRYYKSTSATQHPTDAQFDGSGGSDTMPARENGKYIWRRTVRTKNDGTTTPPIYEMVQGADGATGPQGETGATGNGISSIAYYYKATSTQSRPSASSVTSTTIPTLDETTNKYLWQKEVITYTNNATPKTTVALIGVYGNKGSQGQQGETGARGRGISSITYYYATSTTQSAPSASSITSTTIPAMSTTNKYLWQKEVIAYSDNSTPKTTVSLIAVYGDKGDKGDTGATGPQGVSITKTEPLWFLRNAILDIPPVGGNTEQAGSSGKNLVGLNQASYTATVSSYWYIDFNSNDRISKYNLVANTTYVFSAYVETTVKPFNLTVGCGNGTYSHDIPMLTSYSFSENGRVWVRFKPTATDLQSGTLFAFRVPRYSSGQDFTYTVKDIQLEIGSDMTAYEPHISPTNPQPIHNVSGDNEITVVNKNLFDIENDYVNTKFSLSGGTLFNTATDTRAYFFLSILALNGNTVVSVIYANSFSTTGEKSVTFNSGDLSNVTRLRLKHNGSSNDLEIAYVEKSSLTANTSYTLSFNLISNNPTTVNGLIISNIQLEKGSTATPYEPYTRQSYPLYLPVENLIPRPYYQADGTYQGVTWATDNNGKITGSGTTTAGTNFLLTDNSSFSLPAGTYTLSITGTMTGIDLKVYNGSAILRTIVRGTTNGHATFTLLSASGIRVYFNTGTTGDNVNVSANIQLEKGSHANHYTPYGTTPIELNKIGTYQDYIYKNGGKWYVHKETASVDMGTLTYQTDNGGVYFYSSVSGKGRTNFDLLCTCYTVTTSTNTSGMTDYQVKGQTSGSYIFIKDSRYTSPTDLKTALSGETLKYNLATATNTEITDTTLINQLNNIEKAYSYGSTTNILQFSNDLPFIFTINTTATETPARPTAKVTTSSTQPEVWSLTPATYVDNYKYYTCEQVTFSNASVGYSDPVLATELNNVHVSIDEINTDINQTKESILLKVDTETYEADYEFLNGEISDLHSTTDRHSSSIATLQEGIALKVSSSQVQSRIDSATSQMKTDIKNLQSSALTINSEGITSLVTRVNTLEQVAEGSALKVKADGTYIYKGVADASGNVTLDENNYTKIDTTGSHTISNNKEVTWNTADGTGTPKLSIGSSSADVQRWTFSMDGDLLNIRWIDS